MITWGINALNHDASISVFDNDGLIEHKLSYDFSKIKGDMYLDNKLVEFCLNYGSPDLIYWYEKPWLKKLRQLRAGQYIDCFTLKDIPRVYLKKFNLKNTIKYTSHHHSHAAAGYYTSPFQDAAVVVLDAIGEWETCTIWHGQNNKLIKVWSRIYPTSLGIFYSAFTKLIGLEPLKEENKFTQLSLKGNSDRYYNNVKNYFDNSINLRYNLHRGVFNWPQVADMNKQDKADIAAAVQRVFQEQADKIMVLAQTLTGSRNLVYMGGCAHNSLYNEHLIKKWNKVWSIGYPGDSGSSIGAVLAHTKQRINYNYPTKHITIKL